MTSSTMKSKAAYTADLAHVHHVGFGDFARDSAPGLLGLLRAARGDGGQVIDLGCGSGIWAAALLRAGYDVTGVDPSSAMLVLARQVAPGARFVRASAYDFDIPACDAVTAIGEVLSYLPPGAKAAPSLPRLFRRIAGALRPGGLLVFDLIVTEKRRPMAYRTWRSGDDWSVLVSVSEQPARRRLVREITTFRRVGARYRRSHETHVVRICLRAAIERMLRQAGFSVRVLRGYGAARLAPRRLAFCARKTGHASSVVSASDARIRAV
jgi:SAM-dependent methyltransferase